MFINFTMRKAVSVLVSIVCVTYFLAGCTKSPIPTTLGEVRSGYTYIPLDPTKLEIDSSECAISYKNIKECKYDDGNDLKVLNLLPDNAIRLSRETVDRFGNVTYGASKVEGSGTAYKLTADYVNSDTVNKNVWIARTKRCTVTKIIRDKAGKVLSRNVSNAFHPVSVPEGTTVEEGVEYKDGNSIINNTVIEQTFECPSSVEMYDVQSKVPTFAYGYEQYSIPVYVGIGLRIVAEGTSNTEDATLSGIGIVAAQADEQKAGGSLIVQTLGVNGEAVASALPVQSQLTMTNAENAFVALGAIKAILRQKETIISPRVVGLYLPIPGGKPLVNALISELSRYPVKWCPSEHVIAKVEACEGVTQKPVPKEKPEK